MTPYTLKYLLDQLPDVLPGKTALLTMEKRGDRYRFDYVAINGLMYFNDPDAFCVDPREAAALLLEKLNEENDEFL